MASRLGEGCDVARLWNATCVHELQCANHKAPFCSKPQLSAKGPFVTHSRPAGRENLCGGSQ